MLNKVQFILLWILCITGNHKCVSQAGPDPWNYEDKDLPKYDDNDMNLPPDLRIHPKKQAQSDNLGTGEWFFRRIVGIVLKGGQIKENDDGSVDVSLQMRIDQKKWETLDKYMQSNSALTEEMYRLSMGYIEEAIYQPTITDKIVMAWSDYIQIYLIEYKTHITWTLTVLTMSVTLFWLWIHMSHKHLVAIIVLALYLYEVFVSYKEAEKQEFDKFFAAVNSCKWYSWSSTCELPKPDLLIFLKHMNPLKIGIRMFTYLISEPMINISDSLKTMVHGITDGMWYPLDKIVYGVLIISFNVILLLLLVMVIFNFILNIPFDLSFGLINLAVKQRNRTLFAETNSNNKPIIDNNTNTGAISGANNSHTGAISGATIDKAFDLCSRALNIVQSSSFISRGDHSGSSTQGQITHVASTGTGLRRSASAGRLTNMTSTFENNNMQTTGKVNKRKLNLPLTFKKADGSGDAA